MGRQTHKRLTKFKKRRDEFTMDMFDEYTPPKVEVALEAEVTKGGSLDVKIARALSHAMHECDRDRETIAAEMSDYLGGQNITLNMLDSYASPARRDHKITLERFIALVHVTGCHDVLGFVAEFSDFAVVPKKFVKIIEREALQDHQDKMTKALDVLNAKIAADKR